MYISKFVFKSERIQHPRHPAVTVLIFSVVPKVLGLMSSVPLPNFLNSAQLEKQKQNKDISHYVKRKLWIHFKSKRSQNIQWRLL